MMCEIRILNMDQMSDALSGKWIQKEGRVEPHWLEIKDIKYWHGMPVRGFSGKAPEYYWVAALAPAEENGVRRATGLIELQVNPYDDSMIWLKNVSVHESWRRQGIASAMIDAAGEFLSDKSWKVSRSTPSEDGQRYIQKRIDDVLDQLRISWEQSMPGFEEPRRSTKHCKPM